ncbi:MAG: ABC transporter ATP-binding protein [Acidobacteria bacterium]|nr:MAG: ABC transporter ATP-binding protein [Acidobacteriota bacterium]
MRHDFEGPMIRVVDLVSHYGERLILNHVSLDVGAGETMVILGGSGAGKSTLLRHIIRLERPTAGHVYIRDQDACCISEERFNLLRAKMGMLFQSAALFNSMTVEENVALPLRELTHLEDSTIRIMTRMKLELVGLGGVEDYMPSELLKLKHAFMMTIVVVTHEMASAFVIADRITVMHHGEVIAIGTPDEIRANPHPRVQQFLNRTPEIETAEAPAYLRPSEGRPS